MLGVRASPSNNRVTIVVEEMSPSDRELDILKVLWEIGSGSVREVHERLCPGGELAFNTVQTLLRIMSDKGLVKHRAEGRTFIYTPAYSREAASSRFLTKVFDGALDQLVLSMLRAKDVSAKELRELEQLLVRARQEKKGRSKEETGS
jgi:predicted transcriptional regulator